MLKVLAPAKINLHLHVTGKRPDGYHLLDSLVCFADIGDSLTFEDSEDFTLKIEGAFGNELSAHNNSVTKAASLLAAHVNRELNIRITLEKNLPMGAGIGGGSADAAACLKALNQFWPTGMGDEELRLLALQIGSDVPVCLKNSPVIMQGIGDVISAAPFLPPLPAVLIWPGIHASTPEVYKNLTMENFSETAFFKSSYLDVSSFTNDLSKLHNDLEVPAIQLFPVIAEALAELKDTNCRLARMSGSGSCVFGIFDDKEKAAKASQKISANRPGWWVRAVTLNA